MSPCWVMPSSILLRASSSSSSTTPTNHHHHHHHHRNQNKSRQFSTHSQRGKRAVSLLPDYLSDARAVTQYCPTTAPDGALQLGVAENQMLEDLLVPALTGFASPFTADSIYYQPTHGRPGLRTAFAAYLERLLKLPSDIRLDPEGLVMGTGCNAVLENLCITLAEPGEGVMIPTPYYAAFEFDLVARAGLSILPVNTFAHSGADITDDDNDNDNNNNNSIPIEAYYPTKAGLTAALKAAREEGESPRILLISHPNNPLGISYPPHVVQDCIDWCRDNQIHLISDEIYAGSIHDNDKNANFKSALELSNNNLGDYVHFVYSLSKDFALSGLRIGAVYSENKHIRTPLQKLNDLCQIPSQTQVLVETMVKATLDDDDFWTDDFLAENQNRIRARCDALQAVLDEFRVPHLKATSGLFCWMDMSQYLPSDDSNDDNKRERTLYLELMNDYGLLFTPGLSMKNERPGFFRCVFTAASDEEFALALVRIRTFCEKRAL